MALSFKESIEHVIAIAQEAFDNVIIFRREERKTLAILEINASFSWIKESLPNGVTQFRRE
jgi:hypothetical protein